jgi:hypothetical protein
MKHGAGHDPLNLGDFTPSMLITEFLLPHTLLRLQLPPPEF